MKIYYNDALIFHVKRLINQRVEADVDIPRGG
jgi:hypothetical protein